MFWPDGPGVDVCDAGVRVAVADGLEVGEAVDSAAVEEGDAV